MKRLKIREHPSLIAPAAQWFHLNGGFHMKLIKKVCKHVSNKRKRFLNGIFLSKKTKHWGSGVIANDFHLRKDVSPNLCALYIELDFRQQGFAKRLLQAIREDLESYGIVTLYLITDHTAFYEHCGWHFYCMVEEEESGKQARMYRITKKV